MKPIIISFFILHFNSSIIEKKKKQFSNTSSENTTSFLWLWHMHFLILNLTYLDLWLKICLSWIYIRKQKLKDDLKKSMRMRECHWLLGPWSNRDLTDVPQQGNTPCAEQTQIMQNRLNFSQKKPFKCTLNWTNMDRDEAARIDTSQYV